MNWMPLGQRSTRWLVTASTLLASSLAGLLAWLYTLVDDPRGLNALGFGFTLAGVALSVGIFSWSAQTAARRVQSQDSEDVLFTLASTDLTTTDASEEHLQAIAERRGLGETPQAIRGLLVAVWRPAGPGRAPRAYLLEGPDLWFVNATAARHTPTGSLRVEKTPTGNSWARRPAP